MSNIVTRKVFLEDRICYLSRYLSENIINLEYQLLEDIIKEIYDIGFELLKFKK